MPALRVALVGAGNIASHHLPAYAQFPGQVDLVAICDLDEGLARRRAHDAGVERVYTDVDALLREVACDALDVCVTPDQHAPVAYVRTPVKATPISACQRILDFYGEDYKGMRQEDLIRTVKNAIHDVVIKLGLRNRTHAVAYALRKNLI